MAWVAKTSGFCVVCDDELESNWGGRLYCYECRVEKDKLLTTALRAVRREISCGRLPHPRNLVCKDCGAQARCYDHRNYNKPLKVEPLCYSCNSKRGPAKWKAA